ncbi:hypothetical protein T12_9603 [Trichinella patagoniensis]|uniref:Uncharacterized protein n=1 Tax=Trichinella patagoniensis TaxID=990121 RepID=A0A0V0YXD1_9BILA|nr:hypothetical protein T12_9603 [Trichinella patagoniensis]
MISIPEKNCYHYSIFYCTKVTLFQIDDKDSRFVY